MQKLADSKRANLIFSKLNEAGFPESCVRHLLPSWWDDRISENPAGLAEFNLAVSRNLGVDVEGLSADKPRIVFRLPGIQKLKRSIRYTEADLTPAVSVAISAARVAVQAARNPYTPLPPAHELRQAILDNGARYVSLKALLRVCWDHGIPVLHVSQFPDGMPKMDGLAVVVNDRPAIVISKITKFSSWMSFILAHEMGHVANGHCGRGEMIVDVSLDETTYSDNDIDEQESEADNYAMQLLSDNYDISNLSEATADPETLAIAAMAVHRSTGIDAGHLILRHAYLSKNWRIAIAALKGIDTENRAIPDVLTPLEFELDFNAVSKGALAFLFRACGLRVDD